MDQESFRELVEHFEHALELDPSALPDHLPEMCGDDPELRERLLKLLEAHEQLSTPETTPVSGATVTFPSVGGEAYPSTIGKYRVLSCLGSGGQATVYHALHPHLGREVVIKLDNTAASAPAEWREKLLTEGRSPGRARGAGTGAGL